jgi:phosphatidylethanolamine/phosphatidyl-N-methylethanolamine N-methyltransferase
LTSLFPGSDSGPEPTELTPPDADPRGLSVVGVKNEFVRKVYADISSWYDYFFGPTLHFGRIESMQRLPIGPGDDVLEVGVGTGINALLYPKNCHVTGIDFSASMLTKARRRLEGRGVRNVTLVKMDAVAMDFEDESFDLVYAPYVISVVPDPVDVVREMYRVCRVGGHVVVLNHFRSENRLMSAAEKLISPFTIYMGFKADLDLRGFLEQAQLEPISIDKVAIPPIWSLIVFRKEDESAACGQDIVKSATA